MSRDPLAGDICGCSHRRYAHDDGCNECSCGGFVLGRAEEGSGALAPEPMTTTRLIQQLENARTDDDAVERVQVFLATHQEETETIEVVRSIVASWRERVQHGADGSVAALDAILRIEKLVRRR